MMKRVLRPLITSSTVLGLAACGTQIGNPTGGKRTGVLSDSSKLNSLSNAAFLTTLDGLNMGDYAYSKQESRLVSKRSCQLAAGNAASLVQKAASSHTVEDRTELVSARSELVLDRNYQDVWSQNGKSLACEVSTGDMKLDLRQLADGPVQLSSQVNEQFQRKLTATLPQSPQVFRHSLTTEKQGLRTLKFLSFQRRAGLTEVAASLNQANLLETVELTDELGQKESVQMRLGDRPLDFRISIDSSSGLWTSYTIDSAALDFYVNESESFTLELNQLRFERASGCVPKAGTVRVRLVDANQQAPITYVGHFDDGAGNLVMNPVGVEAKPLILAPFGCVLREQ